MRGAAAGTRGNGGWAGTSGEQGGKNGPLGRAAEGFETRYIYVFSLCGKCFNLSAVLYFSLVIRGKVAEGFDFSTLQHCSAEEGAQRASGGDTASLGRRHSGWARHVSAGV